MEQTERRRETDAINHAVVRAEETQEERKRRLIDARLRQQARIAEETIEEAGSERNAEQMGAWRAVENVRETEERLREQRERNVRERDRLRLQQEETDELQRAFNARNHAEIVPEVTQEELEVLIFLVEELMKLPCQNTTAEEWTKYATNAEQNTSKKSGTATALSLSHRWELKYLLLAAVVHIASVFTVRCTIGQVRFPITYRTPHTRSYILSMRNKQARKL